MTIEGDQLSYDLTGSHPAIGTLPQRGLRHHLLGRRRRDEDLLPGRAAQLRLLPRGRGRPRAGRIGRQRPVAGRGDRLLRRTVREDHELDLRALVAAHARAGDRLLASTSSTCSSAAATRATRAARSSCGTTGWSAAGAAATARTARTATAPDLRRRARRPAARGAGAALPGAHDRARDPHRLRRARDASAAAAASRRARS